MNKFVFNLEPIVENEKCHIELAETKAHLWKSIQWALILMAFVWPLLTSMTELKFECQTWLQKTLNHSPCRCHSFAVLHVKKTKWILDFVSISTSLSHTLHQQLMPLTDVVTIQLRFLICNLSTTGETTQQCWQCSQQLKLMLQKSLLFDWKMILILIVHGKCPCPKQSIPICMFQICDKTGNHAQWAKRLQMFPNNNIDWNKLTDGELGLHKRTQSNKPIMHHFQGFIA